MALAAQPSLNDVDLGYAPQAATVHALCGRWKRRRVRRPRAAQEGSAVQVGEAETENPRCAVVHHTLPPSPLVALSPRFPFWFLTLHPPHLPSVNRCSSLQSKW